MPGKLPLDKGDLFRDRLDSIIHLNHALVRLSNELDWGQLEDKYPKKWCTTGVAGVEAR